MWVCKDISIAYHSLLFLPLLIESQCLLLCLCLLFVWFVCFPLIMFLCHRSQSTWVSRVNTWFRFYSSYAMLTSWVLFLQLLASSPHYLPSHPSSSSLALNAIQPPSFVPWTEGTHACSRGIWIDCSVRGQVPHTHSNHSTFLSFFSKKSVLVICLGTFMFIDFHNTNQRVIRNVPKLWL